MGRTVTTIMCSNKQTKWDKRTRQKGIRAKKWWNKTLSILFWPLCVCACVCAQACVCTGMCVHVHVETNVCCFSGVLSTCIVFYLKHTLACVYVYQKYSSTWRSQTRNLNYRRLWADQHWCWELNWGLL